ncbi:MAG: hypothetical protein FWE82_02020 [Defluviitaleaceae bacterium]|nr:hypothetical protein [Defluviitaleaceae bacterium]
MEKKYFVSVDAGGSSSAALMFDENLSLAGEGFGGGVNTNQGYAKRQAAANFSACLRGLFSITKPYSIDTVFFVFIGRQDIFFDIFSKHAPVKNFCPLGETEACLLAGTLEKKGIVAMSGTGSVAGFADIENKRGERIGGWGPVLGDQGSGGWIGREVLTAAVAAFEGWGEQTTLLPLLLDEWKLANPHGFIGFIHGGKTPYGKIAALAKIAGLAAADRDAVALHILSEAGSRMAEQTSQLISRGGQEYFSLPVVCCGGAWKTHPVMYETFRTALQKKYPQTRVKKPMYENAAAGPVKFLLDSGSTKDEAEKIMAANFSKYKSAW